MTSKLIPQVERYGPTLAVIGSSRVKPVNAPWMELKISHQGLAIRVVGDDKPVLASLAKVPGILV